jgi:pimeloyl-ACP methyl ester carboxylesterase
VSGAITRILGTSCTTLYKIVNYENAWLSPSPLNLPSPILRVWMKKELDQVSQNEAIWHAVHEGAKPPNLLALAPEIAAETLIIWCEPDRILHISGAQVLADELHRASLKTLQECGHVPMIDRPVDVAETYRAFSQRNAAQLLIGDE